MTHAAEIWFADPASAGPTGDHAEVIRGEVRDAGGNVLYAGPAGQCTIRAAKYIQPTTLVPTGWRRVEGEVSGATHTWQPVIAPEGGGAHE